ncbi:MAG: mannonate dehydratase [Armatimonadota bacterium]
MNRREFMAAAAGTAAVLVLDAHPQIAQAAEKAQKPKRALMKLACQRYGSDSQADVEYYQRYRVEAVNRSIGQQSVAELVTARERLAACGISIVGRINASLPDVLKGGDARETHLKAVCDEVRRAGEAGIGCVLYNLVVPGDARTEPVAGRGGSSYVAWDLEQARKKPPVSELGPISAKRSWEGITIFLEHVVPVAEKYRVRLACHPHDPPYPPEGLNRVVRVLGTVEGLQHFVSIAASDYHGLNFCQGTVAEMLSNDAKGVFAAIRWFGERKKIFNVHFRNLRGGRTSFYEVYPDEGAVDMLQAMRAYRDIGYDGTIMPDHLPLHPNDPEQRQAFAYAYGYIRGLIQAVDGEVAGT